MRATTASQSSGEVDHQALAGGEDLDTHRRSARRGGGGQAVDHVVVVTGVVVEQRQPLGAHLARQPHGVLDGAVPPRALAGELGRRVLGVVDQQVDALAQVEHAVGDVRPAHRLLVVADVGDAPRRRASPGSRAPRRRAGRRRSRRRTRRSGTSPPARGSRSGRGSRRGRPGTAAGRSSTRAPRRPSDRRPAPARTRRARCRSCCSGPKNGRPCTWSQCRWLTQARAAERLVTGARQPEVAQAGAEVEQQRVLAGRVDRHARRVAAVASDVVAMARRRAPHAMKRDQHACSPTPSGQRSRDTSVRRRYARSERNVNAAPRDVRRQRTAQVYGRRRWPAPPPLADGLVVVVKEECETCRMVAPLLADLAGKVDVTVYTQDDPEFPTGVAALHDDDLAVSWHHDIETVPTLLRVVDGVEVERTVGWSRAEWQRITGLDDLGEDLPGDAPGVRLAERRPRPRRRAARALRGRPAALAARRARRARGRDRGDVHAGLDRRAAGRAADRGAGAAHARGHDPRPRTRSSPRCRRTSSTSPSRRSPSPP